MVTHSKLPATAETPGTREVMKIFLDAWYPGSPAQLALDSNDQGDQGDEDWGNHTTVLAFFLLQLPDINHQNVYQDLLC